jgi:glycosyltransferase involved in cell wall biosynthesis
VYLEAMRMGRPCVVSTADAGREVVCPEGGLAVDPADSAQLGAALLRSLTPGSEWDTWSAGGRKRYETGYTEEHFRGRLLAALASLS